MAGYTSYSIIQRTNRCYKHKTIYYEPEMYKIYACFAVLQVLLIFHGKIHNFNFISIIRVQQFYIIVDIFYITSII